MVLKRKSENNQNQDRKTAVAWINITLVNSQGKKFKLPVGIPLNEDSEDAVVQGILAKAPHGFQWNAEATLTIVGQTKSVNEEDLFA